LEILKKRDLLTRMLRWQYLGRMPNNQSIVHAQQSTPAAALVEKFTNGLDAILLRECKKAKIDPRSASAPASMSEAIQRWFGDLSSKTASEIRSLAEENLVLYATGTKARPSLSLYDAGSVAPDPDALYATFTLRNTQSLSGWRSRNQHCEPP
jgi:hypothetical protein